MYGWKNILEHGNHYKWAYMDEIKSPEKPFYFKLSSIEMSCRSVIFVPKTTL